MNNKSNYPAILGGNKVRKDPLPTYNMIGEEEKTAVMKVLDSGILSGFAAQPNKDFFIFCRYFLHHFLNYYFIEERSITWKCYNPIIFFFLISIFNLR